MVALLILQQCNVIQTCSCQFITQCRTCYTSVMINQNECRTWYTSSQCRTCYTSKTYIHVGHSIPLASVGLLTPLSVGIVLNPHKGDQQILHEILIKVAIESHGFIYSTLRLVSIVSKYLLHSVQIWSRNSHESLGGQFIGTLPFKMFGMGQ